MPLNTSKTIPTKEKVSALVDAITDDSTRRDFKSLIKLIGSITGEKPVLWGSSIIGFGRYHYRYASGHEGDAALIGISPRKAAITLYLAPGYEGFTADVIKKPGKVKTGKGCLYIRKLEDVDEEALARLIRTSIEVLRERYG